MKYSIRTAILLPASLILSLGISQCTQQAKYVKEEKEATSETSFNKISRLKVSENGRFLVKEDGTPFFWLGDTGWLLFQKLRREQTDKQPAVAQYFKNRAAKQFNVIQTTFFFFLDDDHFKNAYGHEPFIEGDFTRPRIIEGPDNDFWDMADYIIDQAEGYGLYLALLPVWGVHLPHDHPMVKDPSIAYHYGHFVGTRYRKKSHLIWVLGGDPYREGTDVDNPDRLAMIRAMAEGMADAVNGENEHDQQADYSTTLMTYHPRGGGRSSSEYLHQEDWLDFNMMQTGPGAGKGFPNYKIIHEDYHKNPVKPAMDAEPGYENAYDNLEEGRYDALDVRRWAYWNVFAGGHGHTYGALEMWQFYKPGDEPYNRKERGGYWYEIMDYPGCFDLRYLRALMESRPFLTRIPDQSMIADKNEEGPAHIRATRSADGSYAFVYIPTGQPVTIHMDKVSGNKAKAYWYDPREGVSQVIGNFPTEGRQTFTPPKSIAGNDWVLVLDDMDGNFASPSKPALNL